MSARQHKVTLIPDPRTAEIEWRFYETRARRLRSQAFGALFRRAARALGGVIGGGVHSLKRRRAERAAYRELAALDDHLLRDIGITRGEIWNVVRGEPRTIRETEETQGTRRRRGRGRPVPGARKGLGRREAA